MGSLPEKYRPATFNDVVGQPEIVKSLKRVTNDKRHHSFILTGPAGCGKTTLARLLAKEFAGKNATVANIEEFDAATKSGADDVRAVVSRTFYRAIGESSVKAVIMDEAHRLSSAAWTVLLKPIEEPPHHVYWMFCTTEGGKIPKTIQTRCLSYELKPVPEEDILELLCKVTDAEGFETPDEVLEVIAEGCGGSPRQALTFLEKCIYSNNANEARTLIKGAASSKEAIDLCRLLIAGRGKSWANAVNLIKAIEGADAEGIRLIVCNYVAAVLLNTKNEKTAAGLLRLLDCFKTPYNPAEKMAPLLLSVGLAFELDRTDV